MFSGSKILTVLFTYAQFISMKRTYLERIVEVEHATFTPLVFGTNGGMGQECIMFLKNLAAKIAEKENEQYATVINLLRTKLSFCILRSILLCVRGSRNVEKEDKF